MKSFKQATPDVLVNNEGTVFLFNPLTAGAKGWIEANVQATRSGSTRPRR